MKKITKRTIINTLAKNTDALLKTMPRQKAEDEALKLTLKELKITRRTFTDKMLGW